MKSILTVVLTALTLGVAPAHAEERVTLSLPDDWESPLAQADLSVEEFRELPYEPEAYRGAEQLGLHPAYISDVRAGLELLYNRQYREVRDHFLEVDERFPGTGIGAAIDVVVWQAMMLENFDFRYDRQYEVSSRRARSELEKALAEPGAPAGWLHFLMAGIAGIEAIHTMRKERYLPALTLAFEAMGHAGRSRRASPEFVDLLLADGIYNYWRTVVTRKNRMLPDFGDQREEGIAQMQEVQGEGVFLATPAALSLAFTYIEERRMKAATTATVTLARAYPDSIINNIVLGQVLTQNRRYDRAMDIWEQIEAQDPRNDRVHYVRALTLLRSGRSEEAIGSLETYLSSEHLVDHHRAAGHYRMGQAQYRQENYSEAVTQYRRAIRVNGHDGARRALERMRRLRREGRIQF